MVAPRPGEGNHLRAAGFVSALQAGGIRGPGGGTPAADVDRDRPRPPERHRPGLAPSHHAFVRELPPVRHRIAVTPVAPPLNRRLRFRLELFVRTLEVFDPVTVEVP